MKHRYVPGKCPNREVEPGAGARPGTAVVDRDPV